MKSLQTDYDGRRTPSDGYSSGCLWQGELKRDRHGRDRIVVGFKITYAISVYHH